LTERPLWYALEAVHSVVYFATEATSAYEAIGLHGYWMGYFASRAAALGPVGAAPVIATFHGFAPRLVHRALPDAWSRTEPATVLATRADLAAQTLAQVLGEVLGEVDVAEVAALTGQLVAGCDAAGRPLAAAHATLPRPADPLRALWHDATILREHRGDGHVAALTVAGLDGCAANVLMLALGRVPERQQRVRGWDDAEWAAAHTRLRSRGLLDAAGAATDAGRALREQVEDDTDATCAGATAALPTSALARLTTLLVGLARQIATSSAFPYPNPIGVPAP
jgi:hypothetical protein